MQVIVVGSVCIMHTGGVRKVRAILWIYVNLCIHVSSLFLIEIKFVMDAKVQTSEVIVHTTHAI